MSEEEKIIEIQKPKFSKLTIVAVMCCLLGVILFYVGTNFKWSILPWVYGVSARQLYTEYSLYIKASTVSRTITFSAGMVWFVGGVLSIISQAVIKRSNGKLRGKWLAWGTWFVSFGLMVLGLILLTNWLII